MGIVNKFIKRKTRAEPYLMQWLSQDTCCKGYVRLSDCPEVRMAIERIADLVSIMTIHLMVNEQNGDRRIKNELSKKIDVNPCTYMTRQLWVSWIVKHMLLNGNAIVRPVIKDGLIDNLIPVPTTQVIYEDSSLNYQISINNKRFNPDEILHFRINPKEDRPWIGESYKVVLKDVVDNLKQSSHTINEYLSNRIMPSLIVKVDALTDEVANADGRERVFDNFVSANRAGKPWIVPAELIDVQQVKPLSLNDIAIKDTIELSKQTVAGILGIPAFLLGIGAYNADEYNNFIRTRIQVIAKAIEQELTLKLLYSPDMYFKFNSRALYAYGVSELATVYADLYIKGICTGNEVRDILGMSPKEELDELTILENYIPLKKYGEQKKLGGEKDE